MYIRIYIKIHMYRAELVKHATLCFASCTTVLRRKGMSWHPSLHHHHRRWPPMRPTRRWSGSTTSGSCLTGGCGMITALCVIYSYKRLIQHRFTMHMWTGLYKPILLNGSDSFLWQEVHYGDGTVKIDGKVMHESQVEAYRAGSSTRTRSRTRGGAVVRSREPCLSRSACRAFLIYIYIIIYIWETQGKIVTNMGIYIHKYRTHRNI